MSQHQESCALGVLASQGFEDLPVLGHHAMILAAPAPGELRHAADEALAQVLSISARELKYAAGRTERPMDGFFDWLTGKWCDFFAALGPYLVTSNEIDDPKALEMALRVNGELRQHSAADEMNFDVPESIAFISQFVTLEPGGLFCMGTPGGVGVTTPTFLQSGDLVEAAIEGLGRLVNPVR